MSTKIVVQSEVREMAILRDTLTEMGINFNAVNEEVRIQQYSIPIVFNTTTGQVNYDSDQKSLVEDITQKYTANFIRDQYLKEGTNTRQEVDAQGQIHIYTC
jgi:hypothetical protein